MVQECLFRVFLVALLRHLQHFCDLTKQSGAAAFGLNLGLAIGIDGDAADT